jgi:hypothetical protein
MPIPWATIGALSSAASFVYTVFDSDVSNQEILEYLTRLEIKIDEIILSQSALMASINRLPIMLDRVVRAALVDQNYSYINSHFSAYISLSSDSEKQKYIERNYERIRELFEYVVDFEGRIDGQIRLISASEKMYAMLLKSEAGIYLMRNTFLRKVDEVNGFVEDIEQSLIGRDAELSGRLLRHRYIKSHNYAPPMKPEAFLISWREESIRDCVKPGEPDFLAKPDVNLELSWYCPAPNVTIEGAEFKNRFNRIRMKVNDAVNNSIEEAKNYESHSALLEKVYRPYVLKLESHLLQYKSAKLFF